MGNTVGISEKDISGRSQVRAIKDMTLRKIALCLSFIIIHLLQIRPGAIQRHVDDILLLAVVAHREAQAIHARMGGNGDLQRFGLKILFGLDFYRNNMGACLNDKVKFHLTVVLAEIIYRKLAQGLELAANEVLGKVSFASIVLIGQEKHGRGRVAHRAQQATIQKIKLEGADVFINL